MSLILLGFLASLGAGLLTAAGALPVLLGRRVSPVLADTMLGFAAGVMLAASFFSLILPALEWASVHYGGKFIPAFIATTGILTGGFVMGLLNKFVPHEHFVQGKEGPQAEKLNRVLLFALAITIHNLPEGLAVGVGFGGGDIAAGSMLALGIGLQNAPEGLAIGLALLAAGYNPRSAFGIATLTGMVEPVTGLLGAWGVSFSELLLPWAMSFAAGAMIFVISHEIIPETHRHGAQSKSTIGLIIGLAVMMALDTAFGGLSPAN